MKILSTRVGGQTPRSLFASFAFLMSATLLLSSCASTQKIQAKKVDQIKRVALVGFSIDFEMNDDFRDKGTSIIGLAGYDTDEAVTAKVVQRNAKINALYAKRIYKTLRKALVKNMKWRVISTRKVVENNYYKPLFEQWQKDYPPASAAFFEAYRDTGTIGGLLPADYGEKIFPTRLAAIKNLVKADALVWAKVSIDLANPTAISIGDIGPSEDILNAKITLAVIDEPGKTPAWQVSEFKGPESKPVQRDSKNHGRLLRQRSIKTAEKAIHLLFQSYQARRLQNG